MKLIFKDIQATIIIGLSKPLEDLWKNLDKDARWGVNKARKEGLIVRKGSENDIKRKRKNENRDLYF